MRNYKSILAGETYIPDNLRIVPVNRLDRFTDETVRLYRVDQKNYFGFWRPITFTGKSAWYKSQEDAEIAIHCIVNKLDRYLEFDSDGNRL